MRAPLHYTLTSVKSTVEPLEGNKVKVSVEVDAEEFEIAIASAFRTLAQQVNIKGFRRGKVPRKILEAQFGGGMARQQALRDSLPDFYAKAVREHEVDVIAAPEFAVTAGADDGAVAFDAVVEIRPNITISGYEALEVTIPSPHVAEADLEERIERLRSQNGDFESAERPAADGDQVLIDIEGSQDGEEIEGLTAADYQYEVGSGAVVAEIDENLRGAKAGDVLSFPAKHPEEGEGDLAFTVTVKEVRGAVLPEVTDEWVAQVTEFASVEELRSKLGEQLRGQRLVEANQAFQQRTADALGGLVTDDVPEAMIDSEISARIQTFAQRLRQQNVELGRFLQMTGQAPGDLVAQYRDPATQAIKVDLALRAVAEAQSVDPSDEDFDRFFDTQARQFGQSVEEIREAFQRAGQMGAVRSEIKKGKALEWVLERVRIVDEEGNSVDRAALEFPAAEPSNEDDSNSDTPAEPGEDQA